MRTTVSRLEELQVRLPHQIGTKPMVRQKDLPGHQRVNLAHPERAAVKNIKNIGYLCA
jgi:hypothetical protein